MAEPKPDPFEVMSECCWCGKYIPEDREVFALGAKVRPGMDISEYEGEVMPLTIITHGKTVNSFVPPADSDAKRDGNDFLFTICSSLCGYELKKALGDDKSLGDVLGSVHDL